MEVIVLAGGLGTRLRSVVKDVPKCMALVAEHPFLYYILKGLSRYKIERVILSVGYLHNIIKEWIDKHKGEYSFDIEYAIEEEPLGTGGGIRLAMEKIQGNEAVIVNGDTFFDVNLDQLYKEHIHHQALLSIALKPMRNFDRYGKVVLDKNRIKEFKEKQYCLEGEINGGIYIISKINPFFKNLPTKFSFETDVLNPFCKLGLINGFIHDNYFIDIGIPEDYNKANTEFIKLFN